MAVVMRGVILHLGQPCGKLGLGWCLSFKRIIDFHLEVGSALMRIISLLSLSHAHKNVINRRMGQARVPA